MMGKGIKMISRPIHGTSIFIVLAPASKSITGVDIVCVYTLNADEVYSEILSLGDYISTIYSQVVQQTQHRIPGGEGGKSQLQLQTEWLLECPER